MDITSPFIVVPVLAITFLSCILFASLSGKHKAMDEAPDDSNAKIGTH
jgi:hypothetical protein